METTSFYDINFSFPSPMGHNRQLSCKFGGKISQSFAHPNLFRSLEQLENDIVHLQSIENPSHRLTTERERERESSPNFESSFEFVYLQNSVGLSLCWGWCWYWLWGIYTYPTEHLISLQSSSPCSFPARSSMSFALAIFLSKYVLSTIL